MNFYILAGGKSRRMGENKALLELEGKTIIERVIAAIPEGNSAIKIITNSFEDYERFGLGMIKDQIADAGPIAGVHTGLLDEPSTHSFFLACDLPFISTKIIKKIISQYHNQDILGFKSENGFEPLCAIYSKKCIPVIEKQVAQKQYSLKDLVNRVDSKLVDLGSAKVLFNLNSRQDWLSIKK